MTASLLIDLVFVRAYRYVCRKVNLVRDDCKFASCHEGGAFW